MSDKPIAALVEAPVVSSDTTSPESQMAREARKLQVQAATDGAYDTVVERFCGGPTVSLASLAVVLSLFLLAHIGRRRR
jgi:hypothetical protein